MNQKKMNSIIMECYIDLYNNALPKADFKKLLETAPINKEGKKEIDFNSYHISEEKTLEIIENIAKKYKLSKSDTKSFKVSIYLGCSPKFSLQS